MINTLPRQCGNFVTYRVSYPCLVCLLYKESVYDECDCYIKSQRWTYDDVVILRVSDECMVSLCIVKKSVLNVWRDVHTWGVSDKHWVISSLQKASTMDKCVFTHTTTTDLNNSSVCGAKTASHSHRRQSEKERVKVICSFLVTFIINSAWQ